MSRRPLVGAIGLLICAATAGCSSSDGDVAATFTEVATTTVVATSTTTSQPVSSSSTSAPPTIAPTTAQQPATVEARPSAGCSSTSISTGTTTQAFTGSGLAGTYFTQIPSTALAQQPLPLVVDLHGYSEPMPVHVIQSGLASFGETAGFITVAPTVDRPVPLWHPSVGSDDSAFLSALLDQLESTLCVDINRIYFAGLSHGAFMTSIVACDLSDRVAAVAPVAGIQAPADCNPRRPVPVVAFHGTADPFVPYEGGLGEAVASLPTPDGSGTLGPLVTGAVTPEDDPSNQSKPVLERTAIWAARNGCGPTPQVESIAADVDRLQFPCPAGAEVVLYRIDGGGHTWPGSEFSKSIESIVGPTTSSISANDIIWKFFMDHPLRSV